MKYKDIEFLRITPLRGPNIWTYRPIIEAWVDIGDLEEAPSNLIPGFAERLSAWLPSLIEHRCSEGERGGFLQRLRDQGDIYESDYEGWYSPSAERFWNADELVDGKCPDIIENYNDKGGGKKSAYSEDEVKRLLNRP